MDLDFTHVFLPKQSIATDEEVKKLLDTYGIEKNNLPSMLHEDPAAKALNAQPGDVIKCIRVSPVTKKDELYFRIIVEA
ncbi:DNA-directed RNA polymerase subunit H [Candidatus Micrarchaeota archaeon]|nr:DNA-directed RNA polymerase subunit H [Candidatus Micrarchaeota archaeon]